MPNAKLIAAALAAIEQDPKATTRLPRELIGALKTMDDANQMVAIARKEREFHLLELALAHRHEPLGLMLIQHGADWRQIDARHCDAAGAAAIFSEPILRRLAALGAPLDVWGPEHATQQPLHAAAERAQPAVVEFLLAKGLSPNTPATAAPNGYGMAPLHWLARANQESWPALECVRILVRRGADLGQFDSVGYTPLHWAHYNGLPVLAKTLLKLGAPWALSMRTRMDPMELASIGLRHSQNCGEEWPRDAKTRSVLSGQSCFAELASLRAQIEHEAISAEAPLRGSAFRPGRRV